MGAAGPGATTDMAAPVDSGRRRSSWLRPDRQRSQEEGMEYLALIYSDERRWDEADGRGARRGLREVRGVRERRARRRRPRRRGGARLDAVGHDGPRPRGRAARHRRPLRRGEGGARWLLPSRLPLVRRRPGLGGAGSRPSRPARSRCGPSTSTRRPDMKYALLVYSDQSSWEGIDEEEAARRRAESMPRWLDPLRGDGEGRPVLRGPRARRRERGQGRADGRRRASRHRRPVRGDQGA